MHWSLYVSLLVCCSQYLMIVQCDKIDHDGTAFVFDLPARHIPYFLNRRSDLRKKCLDSSSCLYKEELIANNRCFGYEEKCDNDNKTRFSYGLLKCPEPSRWHTVTSSESQLNLFFDQGDFGFIKQRLREMQSVCTPEKSTDASLICSDHLRYCYAKNIVIDFKNLQSEKHSNKYREDVLRKGDIRGRCRLNENIVKARSDHHSPLQSWAAELKQFQRVEDDYDEKKCDMVYTKPVVLMKLDAGISMYHHFCDFVNLYASQHINGSFDVDFHMIQWDTSGLPYIDPFAVVWQAFTKLPVIHLKELDGKKVCFRQVMFPMLARMVFGLYYNMPLVDGCSGSGLVRAFSEHILHRLRVQQRGPLANGKLRILLLSRSTTYRKTLNEQELLNGLKTLRNVEVTKVDYNFDVPFLKQLDQTFNTDILVGMHGSGLTHTLFLPEWAAVFELYNCDDSNCYLDLARLAGIGYFTWKNAAKLKPQDKGHHPTLGEHPKFTNYAFDLEEFLRIISKAIDHVYEHPSYKNAVQIARSEVSDHTLSQKLEL